MGPQRWKLRKPSSTTRKRMRWCGFNGAAEVVAAETATGLSHRPPIPSFNGAGAMVAAETGWKGLDPTIFEVLQCGRSRGSCGKAFGSGMVGRGVETSLGRKETELRK